MPRVDPVPHPAAYDKQVALVLQGGGALGSYQAGVFEALAASPYEPDWVAGISIGAINAAIIAGNPPQDRVAQLRRFWERITPRQIDWPVVDGVFGAWRQQISAQSTMLFGQPGFFAPRPPQDWLSATPPTSYYDTAALKGTLDDLVDFDRINARDGMRLSVGAVNVRTGRFAYFDSHDIALRAEHIMASGALPPGFPPVEIDGELYWDGGIVSNTPLAYVIDHLPRRSMLAFQVDVFQGYGNLPTSLEEVTEREKDIRYSSRTRVTTDFFAEKHEMRHTINELIALLPPDIAATPQARKLYKMGCVTKMDIVQMIYRPFAPQGAAKDYEFSRATMVARWTQGKADAEVTLRAAPWLAPPTRDEGVRVFDVLHDMLVADKHPRASTQPETGPQTVADLTFSPGSVPKPMGKTRRTDA